jgi:excinuclease ABC subunit A
MAEPASITGQYLKGDREIAVPERRPTSKSRCCGSPAPRQQPEGRDGRDPVGVFTCITGVSGGGKITFTIETLYKRRRGG